MLAGCELPSSLEEFAKGLGGQTQETRNDQVSAIAGQPQDDVETEAAAALQDEDAEQTKAAGAAGPKPTREMILTAQKLLAGLGYEPGPLDSLDGPKTRSAVRRFQADAGLPSNGRVTEALVENLSEADRNNTDRDNTGRTGGLGLASKKALPVYAPGDTFVYSDGRTETVTEIDGERVHWRSNDGTVRISYRNFILPAIRRDTNLISEQTTVDVGPDALWPLKAGREISFTANTEVAHKTRPSPRGGSASRWHCLVEAPRTVSVEAGTRRGASSIVLLTRVGGGVFGNDDTWIDAAMLRALTKVKDFNLDVRLVSTGHPPPSMLALEKTFG